MRTCMALYCWWMNVLLGTAPSSVNVNFVCISVWMFVHYISEILAHLWFSSDGKVGMLGTRMSCIYRFGGSFLAYEC